MTDHELHCDCRIELLQVAEERDTAEQANARLIEDLRRGDLERERQRIQRAEKVEEVISLREELATYQRMAEKQLCPHVRRSDEGTAFCSLSVRDVERLQRERDELREAAKELLAEYSHMVGGACALNNRRIAALERLRQLLDQHDDKGTSDRAE